MTSVAVHQVSILLNGVLDHTFRERSVRKSQGSRLVGQVLSRWDSLRPWWATETAGAESKTATLLLLSKLLQVLSLQLSLCMSRIICGLAHNISARY